MPEKAQIIVDNPPYTFGSAINSFANSLNALRDFVALVDSLLDEQQRKLFQTHEKEILTLGLGLNALLKEPMLSDEEADTIKRHVDPEVKIEVTGENSVMIALDKIGTKEGYETAFKAITRGGTHKSLLYRSALISLISSVEWFLSQILHQHLQQHPDASGIKDKLLSLEELKSFNSIDDARKYLVDLRIDEIMWGSFEDWIKYLTEKVKLSLGYIKPAREQLIEIFQRRNVVVHNNGIANSTYLYKVPPDLREGVSLGEQLPISPEYLSKGIDLLESNFILIAAELWKQLEPENASRGDTLTNISFERLTQEKWHVAEGLSFFIKNDKALPDRNQTIGLLNYWQALKWQDRFAEVKESVTDADFSAKDEIYQLARFALLEDNPKFFNLLPQALRNKKLTDEELSTWPIFRGIRKLTEYSEFIREHGKEFGFEEKSENTGNTGTVAEEDVAN
ncbi:MAG: hypothetical protein ACJ71W_02650 [Terriglobales bacterium]